MRIISSTDNRYLGQVIPDVNTGDTVDLGGFNFYVEVKRTLETGQILLSNVNYQLICED